MWQYWLTAAVLYAAVKAPQVWRYLTGVPELCPCHAPPKSGPENGDALRLATGRFLLAPDPMHASMTVAAAGVLLGQLCGRRAFRLPGDAEYYDLIAARHRATGCVSGVRPCPALRLAAPSA